MMFVISTDVTPISVDAASGGRSSLSEPTMTATGRRARQSPAVQRVVNPTK